MKWAIVFPKGFIAKTINVSKFVEFIPEMQVKTRPCFFDPTTILYNFGANKKIFFVVIYFTILFNFYRIQL